MVHKVIIVSVPVPYGGRDGTGTGRDRDGKGTGQGRDRDGKGSSTISPMQTKHNRFVSFRPKKGGFVVNMVVAA